MSALGPLLSSIRVGVGDLVSRLALVGEGRHLHQPICRNYLRGYRTILQVVVVEELELGSEEGSPLAVRGLSLGIPRKRKSPFLHGIAFWCLCGSLVLLARFSHWPPCPSTLRPQTDVSIFEMFLSPGPDFGPVPCFRNPFSRGSTVGISISDLGPRRVSPSMPNLHPSVNGRIWNPCRSQFGARPITSDSRGRLFQYCCYPPGRSCSCSAAPCDSCPGPARPACLLGPVHAVRVVSRTGHLTQPWLPGILFRSLGVLACGSPLRALEGSGWRLP